MNLNNAGRFTRYMNGMCKFLSVIYSIIYVNDDVDVI